MIYNLAQYIINQATGVDIVVNGFQFGTSEEVVEMEDNGGPELPWFDRQDVVVSFLSRAVKSTRARKNAYIMYDLLKKKYGLILPVATGIDGEDFPSIKTWAIRPVNTPQHTGNDAKGRTLYAFSLEITTNEK